MSTQPLRQPIRIRSIVFPNGNQARAVSPPISTPVQKLLVLLNIPSFHTLIMIAGGAAQMEEAQRPLLAQLFTHGVAQFAVARKSLIIDGGSLSGVMELMGIGIAEQHSASPLLGVAPVGCVSYPGQSLEAAHQERVPLDPNHSHFVLVETNEWGGETATMYELASLFSQGCPSVAILANGGAIAIQEVLYNVRQNRPIIVLEGSGRAADQMARLWQEKPTLISDPALAEIIQYGNIHLFPINSTAEALIQLMQDLMR